MKTITMSLSVASIDKAIAELQDYKREFEKSLNYFLNELANKCRDVLVAEYTAGVADANATRDERNADHPVEDVQVTIEPFEDGNEQGYVVIANGKDVCFLEFGTGMYAGFGTDNDMGVDFEIYPGSWSDEHEHTWKHWLRDHPNDPYGYPYTIYPRNAFAKAYAEMKASIHGLAREAFGGHS